VTTPSTSWFKLFIPHALGNCVVDHIALGKYKQRTGARIGLLYDPEIEFHADLIACNPYLDAICSVTEFAGDPKSLVDPTFGRTWNYLIENTERARLRLPSDAPQEIDPVLARHGIGPEDRIISLHIRERGYRYHAPDHEPERFVDPAPFIELARHYTRRGFKVIRIGDPASLRFPAMPGLFDAAHWPEKRLVHDMYFIQRSSVLLGTDSGVWPLGVALGTPTILSNSCHGQPAMGTVRHWFPWEPGHLVLNKRLTCRGRQLSAAEGVRLFQGARWHEIPGETTVSDNTLEELLSAIEKLLRQHTEERAA